MRKKKHRPYRKFTPKPVSKSFSRNPNNKGKPKPSATNHQLKQPKAVEPQPIVGGCWVIEGDTIHIGSNKIRLQESSSDTLSHCFYYTYELQSTYKVENVVLILLRFFFTVTKKLTKYTHNGKT